MKSLARISVAVLCFCTACTTDAQELPPAPAAPPASAPAAAPREEVNPAGVQQAETLLHLVHKTYKSASAMTDTLTIASDMGGTGEELHFQFDNIGGAVMRVPGMTFTTYAERLYITRDDVKDKYFVTDGADMRKTLSGVFGGNSAIPVPITFHYSDDRAEQLKSLGMGLLSEPAIVNAEEKTNEAGAKVHEIRFNGKNGTGKLHIAADTKTIRNVWLDVTPIGAPPEVRIELKLSMNPKIMDKLPQPIIFDPTGRTAVDSLEALEPPVPTPVAVGDEAPNFTLSTLSGESVTLSELKGSVVVLDFWATWCGPCKRALPELQKFSDWAAASGKPVKVFAVDVWERERSNEAKIDKVKKFWDGAGYTMHTLIDLKDEVVREFAIQSIPTTLVIAPNGKVHKVHVGFAPNMVETLQKEVEEALNAK